MRAKTINIYTIDELSESAKNAAVDYYRNINQGDDWWERDYFPNLIEEAESLGFKIKMDKNNGKNPNIYFSLHHQVSGLCFEYTMDFDSILEHFVDKTGWSENKLNFVKKYAEFSLEGVHVDRCYHHERSIQHRYKGVACLNKPLLDDHIDSWMGEIFKKVMNVFGEICRKYYKLIEEEDLRRSSEEAIIETLMAEDYLFLANGIPMDYEE
jgi:hypothetical protein